MRKGTSEKKEKIEKGESQMDAKPVKKENRKYAVILSECGQRCYIDVHTDTFGCGYINMCLPYADLKKMAPEGGYQEGLGYCIDMDLEQFRRFVDETKKYVMGVGMIHIYEAMAS